MTQPDAPVSLLLQEIQAGRREAAEALWRLYYPRMVRVARAHLQGLPRRAADEEDVALGAFDSFFRGAEQGRFPRLEDRDNLWQLLVTITARHAAEWKQHETRQKRGGGDVRGHSALGKEGDGFDHLARAGQEPGFEAVMAEACQRLLGMLPDEELRKIAVWRMEGYTNVEIAAKLGCVRETVERRLRLIRAAWQKEATDETQNKHR